MIADLFACTLENQKLISKYEHKPTPSHPKNNCKKLSAVTKIIIKKVNNEIYDRNRTIWGSSDIYDVENKCTKNEIEVITTSMTTVNVSK